MQEGMQDFEMLSVATYHPCPPPRPAQRTEDELELIFEELLHIKAVAHLSNSVSAGCTLLPPCLHPSPPNPPASHCLPSTHPPALLALRSHPWVVTLRVPSMLRVAAPCCR